MTFSTQRRISRCFAKDGKNYNAGAQPLFCTLDLLFSDVVVAVVFPSLLIIELQISMR